MRSHPFYAPDGMGMAGRSAEQIAAELQASTHDPVLQQLLEVVLPHERDDDGLVHGHNWAVRSDSRASGRDTTGYFHPMVAQQDGGLASIERPQSVTPVALMDDCYDDGLVHNHHWAASKF